MSDAGLQTLLSALTVNHELKDKFISDHSERLGIIKRGYQGQQIDLSDDEIARMLDIKALDLADFTRKFMGYGTERS